MEIDDIRSEITALSGSGKRVVATRRHGLYSSFTLPGLDDMPAVRDTKKRFEDFGIEEDLSAFSFLDIGSNVGAMTFEAARRGAAVTGVEYRHDRVALCNILADKFKLNAAFYQEDLREVPVNGWERPWHRPHDIVLCCSVDEYIDDLEPFYDMLYELCLDRLYFECNRQRGQSVEDTVAILERSGFKDVEYLGSGHSGGISRKRKIYRARGRVGGQK